jgi:hypothetical protein
VVAILFGPAVATPLRRFHQKRQSWGATLARAAASFPGTKTDRTNAAIPPNNDGAFAAKGISRQPVSPLAFAILS